MLRDAANASVVAPVAKQIRVDVFGDSVSHSLGVQIDSLHIEGGGENGG